MDLGKKEMTKAITQTQHIHLNDSALAHFGSVSGIKIQKSSRLIAVLDNLKNSINL